MKRISFSKYNAREIYEWRLALKQLLKGDRALDCETCIAIEKRLKKFLGDEAVFVEKQVKKYPYKIT